LIVPDDRIGILFRAATYMHDGAYLLYEYMVIHPINAPRTICRPSGDGRRSLASMVLRTRFG
jgi:hypothetical protein